MEMSKYRVHAGGTWSQLSPHLQFAYVMQMLFHVSGLLSGEEKRLVEHRKAELADWWCNDVICDPKVHLDAVVRDLNHVGICEFSTYVFSRAADKARNLHDQSAALGDRVELMKEALIQTEEQLRSSEKRLR